MLKSLDKWSNSLDSVKGSTPCPSSLIESMKLLQNQCLVLGVFYYSAYLHYINNDNMCLIFRDSCVFCVNSWYRLHRCSVVASKHLSKKMLSILEIYISVLQTMFTSAETAVLPSLFKGYTRLRGIIESRVLSEFRVRNDYAGVLMVIRDVTRGSTELKCSTLDFVPLTTSAEDLSDYVVSWLSSELAHETTIFASNAWYKLVDRAEFVPQKRGILFLRCEKAGSRRKISWVSDVSCTFFSSSLRDSYIFSQLDYRYACIKCNADKGVCYTPIRLEEIFNLNTERSSSDCFSLLKYRNSIKTLSDTNVTE